MKKIKAMQLVKALRSGEYVQGKGVLVNNEDEFCCLGVACNLSNNPKLTWTQGIYQKWYMGSTSSSLPDEIAKEFGFNDSMGRRSDDEPIMINNHSYWSLAYANDNGCTFKQIADYIENNYEYL